MMLLLACLLTQHAAPSTLIGSNFFFLLFGINGPTRYGKLNPICLLFPVHIYGFVSIDKIAAELDARTSIPATTLCVHSQRLTHRASFSLNRRKPFLPQARRIKICYCIYFFSVGVHLVSRAPLRTLGSRAVDCYSAGKGILETTKAMR